MWNAKPRFICRYEVVGIFIIIYYVHTGYAFKCANVHSIHFNLMRPPPHGDEPTIVSMLASVKQSEKYIPFDFSPYSSERVNPVITEKDIIGIAWKVTCELIENGLRHYVVI